MKEDIVGVVTIGRNEGERLERCLQSVCTQVAHVVYVDSGSSDHSLAVARKFGTIALELDLSLPFTAARARNIGFECLLATAPDLRFVFFVDGDCEVEPDWIPKATAFLNDNPKVGVVYGRRRERYPHRSVFNMLCDLEWSSNPLGEVSACGGDAVMRVEAFRAVEGYRADLICGEEPELCIRIRRVGWKIWHLDDDMTLHDAAMYRVDQWWKRMMRGGYGFAQGAYLHGAPPERHWVRESRRAWIWGLVIPLSMALLSFIWGPWALVGAVLYPVQIARLAVAGKTSSKHRFAWAVAVTLGKFPEMVGQLRFLADLLMRKRSKLIEYK